MRLGNTKMSATTSRTHRVTEYRIFVEGPDVSTPLDAAALPDLAFADEVLAFDVATLRDDPKLYVVQPDAAERPNALRFEALQAERGDLLLMATPRGLDARINGLPAPRIAILDVADQVQVADGVLHVTRYRTPWVGTPAAEHLGRRCPVCSVEIEADTRVSLHDCGAVLHAEEPGDKPDADLLQCVQLGSCPDCDKSVSMTTGFVYTPEL